MPPRLFVLLTFIFLVHQNLAILKQPHLQRPFVTPQSFCRNCDSKLQALQFHQLVLSTLQKDVVSKKLVELDELLSRCGSKEVDIREITITEAQKLFRSGSLTSSQLTQCYLKRIEMMDPHLKSVIEVNPDAVQIAEQADKDRFLGKPISLSPIHGIPILIKDNMGTFDRMETTAGAVAMERLRPKSDADVVKKLRAAGAVILGKTNPSEWA